MRQNGDRAAGSGRNEKRVFGHDAAGETRSRRFPVGETLFDLLGGQFDVERAVGNVKDDDVAVGDGGNRTAVRCFGCHVPRHQAVRRATETAIGEQSDGVAESCANQSGGDGQHFAHAGAAFWSFITNDHDIARIDFIFVDFSEGCLFAVEDASRATEIRGVVSRQLL